MFVTDELCQKLKSALRANRKPWLPTIESTISDSINELPGLACFSTDSYGIEGSFGHIETKIFCTLSGLQYAALINDELKELVETAGNLRPAFVNVITPMIYDDVFIGVNTSMLKICYIVHYKNQKEFVKQTHKYLEKLNQAVLETKNKCIVPECAILPFVWMGLTLSK
jgi:hypothetical protein